MDVLKGRFCGRVIGLSHIKCLHVYVKLSLDFFYSFRLSNYKFNSFKSRKETEWYLLLYTAQVQVLSAALRAAQFDSVGDCEARKMEESSGELQNQTISDQTAVSDATCNQVEEGTLSSSMSQDSISEQPTTSVLKSTVSMCCALWLIGILTS